TSEIFPGAAWPTAVWGDGNRTSTKNSCSKNYEISILGPSFSGAAQSLDLALSTWLDSIAEPKPELNIKLISGSATAISLPTKYARAKRNERADFSNTLSKVQGRFSFSSMENPDSATIPMFLHYLAQQHCIGSRAANVALLLESGTVYGDQGTTLLEQLSTQKDKKANKSQKDDKKEPDCEGRSQSSGTELDRSQSSDTDIEVTTLRYPLHISQLRAASTKLRQSQQQATPQVQAPGKTLPLAESLEDVGNRRDVETFSPASAVTSERVMANILSTISREGYKYV